jgi:signal peptidase I
MSDRRRRLLRLGRDVLETVVLAVVLVVLMNTFVARTYAVEQWSMEDTLHAGQRITVDELTPRFGGYHRGDIVVLHAPDPYDAAEDHVPIIKRVIGVAGDRIVVRNGHVEVNGNVLDEPYVFEGQPTVPTARESSWTVPAGSIFVLGDHREVSLDSRIFGPVPLDRVIGRAWLRILPLDSFGILQTATYPNLSPSPK